MEYKLGDPERGRTIFEGIVDSYPKRLDLWRVYIDKEIQQRNTGGVR
jgi:rRNA biogenesis protein RRP5